MFGELFERIFRIDEGERTIRAIYRVYKDHERGTIPDTYDLYTALEGMKSYYSEYMEWWDQGCGKTEPKELKKAYRDRYDEIVSALSSREVKDKIIALDNAINQWHMDYPVIAHLEMKAGEVMDDALLAPEIQKLFDDTYEILRRLGRLPEESPYIRR